MSGAPLVFGLAAVLAAIALASGTPVLLSDRLDRRPALTALGQAAAAGVFLGGGLVHMLPDAAADFGASGRRYPWPFVVCGAAVLLLALLEALARRHMGEAHAIEAHGIEAHGEAALGGGAQAGEGLPLVTALVLGVHSLLAGAALGVTTQTAEVLLVFLALAAHKGAASFSLALMLARSRTPRAWAWVVFLLFVACLPAGVAAGRLVSAREHAAPGAAGVMLALGAGTFLYLGTTRSGVQRRGPGLGRGLATAAGFAVMALVAAVA